MKNQTFGIELEMNGILRTKAAQVIAEHFGTHPSQPEGGCYHTQTIRMPDGRVWKVMRDSSIPGPDAEKTEVVSPICRWEDIETVQELVRKLRAAGAKADPAHCGIHVHIGLGEHTPQSLRRLVNIVNAKEDLLTQALAIDPERRMQWCRRSTRFPPQAEHSQTDHHGSLREALVQRPRLEVPREPALRPEPVPPAQPPRGVAEGHHRVPRLQQHPPRRRGQGHIQLCMAISHKALTSRRPAR